MSNDPHLPPPDPEPKDPHPSVPEPEEPEPDVVNPGMTPQDAWAVSSGAGPVKPPPATEGPSRKRRVK